MDNQEAGVRKVEGNGIFKNHLGVDIKVFQQASWYLGGAKEDPE